MLANGDRGARIVILGRGRAGKALSAALREQGLPVSLLPARGSLEKPATPATLSQATLLILAVPDRFVGEAADALSEKLPFSRGVALHLSGALDHSVLIPLCRKGRSVASFHPIQSLLGEPKRTGLFSGITFGIEGQPKAVRAAFYLARKLGAAPVKVRRETKTLYHLASALASNATIGLLGMAEAVMTAAGLSERRARAALAPLVRRSVENALTHGPGPALTGPVARGDESTLARHRKALGALDPSLVPVLEALISLQRRLISGHP